MKISFINASHPGMPCGIGDYAANLARAAARAGHDVAVFTSADARVRVPPSPPVHPIFRDWTVLEFARHARRIRTAEPDVVVLQYPSLLPGPHSRLLFLLPLLTRAVLPRARVILIVHEYAHTHAAARRLLEVSFAFAHEIVAVNPADHAAIGARSCRARRRLRLAGMGSNVARVPVVADRRQALRERRPVLFFFGLLHGPDKGLDDLLEAVSRLEDRAATLVIGGSLEHSHPYHREVRDRIAALGLQDRVRWIGFLELTELSEWLQSADVVVLPFRGGAAGNRTTLTAALLNGAAVITTTGPEVPAYLRDGENALLVTPRNPGALAGAVATLLADPGLSRRLRQGARRVAPRFEWSTVAAETLGLPDARLTSGEAPAPRR